MKDSKINPIMLIVSSPATNQVLFSGTVIKTRDGQSMSKDIPDQYFVLKVNSTAYASEYDGVEVGQYIVTVPMMQNIKEQPLNFLQKKEALHLYDRILEDKKLYPYEVVGRSYVKDGDAYTESEKRSFACPRGVQSVDEARMWMLQTHPDFYLGSVIQQTGPYSTFFIVADPNQYANVTGLESVEEMLLFEAEELGVEFNPVKENFNVYEDIRDLSDDAEEYEF